MNKRQLIFGAVAGVALAAIPTTAYAAENGHVDYKPYDGRVLFSMQRVTLDGDVRSFIPTAEFQFDDNGYCAPHQDLIDDLYAVHGYTLKDVSRLMQDKGVYIVVIQDKYMLAYVRR